MNWRKGKYYDPEMPFHKCFMAITCLNIVKEDELLHLKEEESETKKVILK